MTEHIDRELASTYDGSRASKIRTCFAQIIVGGTAEKPYYSILWLDKDKKEYNIGYSSYCLECVFKWLKEEFEIVASDEPPSADVATVRHGMWICMIKGYGEYEYSVCHGVDSNCSDYYGIHVVTGQELCQKCGAKMDGGENNDKP